MLLSIANAVKLVKLDTAAMSDIAFLARFRLVRLVRLATGDMSDTMLFARFRSARLVKLSKRAMSETMLLARFRFVRLTAESNPVRSLILAFLASRRFKVSISATVIAAPDGLLSAFSIAARRLESGISTPCADVVSGRARQINRKKRHEQVVFSSI